MATSIPGFAAPAVGFDQPFEMLYACHERVQRTLRLLNRLVDHVATQGHDAQSRAATADVLRYFDLAAPLHHEDEERHVFPQLLQDARTSPALRETVQKLQADHRQMEALWTKIRACLQPWLEAHAQGQLDDTGQRVVADFIALYAQHIDAEEMLAYPAARNAMTPDAENAMGWDMQARRQTP